MSEKNRKSSSYVSKSSLNPEEREKYLNYRRAYYQANKQKIQAQNKASLARRKAANPEKYSRRTTNPGRQEKMKTTKPVFDNLAENEDRHLIVQRILDETSRKEGD